MDIESLLSHHQLTRNPFDAEEARHDPVFARMMAEQPGHPDFPKILGQLDKPSASVVFGEKGTGKTAIRLLVGQRIKQYNQQHPDRRTLLVGYDDLNPVLDRIVERQRRGRFGRQSDPADRLQQVRLEDHQDAISSLAVTQLVDALLHDSGRGTQLIPLPEDVDKRIKKMPRRQRVDAAVLAALYDQPRSGRALDRWPALLSKLRVGRLATGVMLRWLAVLVTVVAVGLAAAHYVQQWVSAPMGWELPVAAVVLAAAIVLWVLWAAHQVSLWRLSRRIHKETRPIDREPRELATMLARLSRGDLSAQPWPTPGVGAREARYQLTQRLLQVLEPLGYSAMLVLVDRVDEPTLVTGKAERMKPIIWPMFDNKFLQQEGVGIKLLLPIELRHLLYREGPEFFQEARLDKQHMIDRLSWSGPVLYDLCSRRLQACRAPEADPLYLTDLFEEDVTRETLIDALDQMHQPRDAFKFLYSVIMEHCRMVPQEAERFQVPRLVLESVRRTHAQRVQELQRGLSPA